MLLSTTTLWFETLKHQKKVTGDYANFFLKKKQHDARLRLRCATYCPNRILLQPAIHIQSKIIRDIKNQENNHRSVGLMVTCLQIPGAVA